MATESERSRDRGRERSREGRRERRERRDRPSDVTPTVDRGSSVPDTAAIEAARARAFAAGVTTREEKQEEDPPVFNFATRAKETVVGVGKGGLQVMGGSLVVFGYLGYQASRPVLFTAAHALDWIGQRMNSLADKLIDKKIPVVSWFLNPVISVLDSSAKKLGIDKTLAEHLKKNAEDRKKLAEKVLKDFREAEKKYEKKLDDAAKKKTRQKKLKEVLGEDAAAILEGEMEDIEGKETPAAATPVPAETSKAA